MRAGHRHGTVLRTDVRLAAFSCAGGRRSTHPDAAGDGPRDRPCAPGQFGSHLAGSPEAVALDQPLLVVPSLELAEGLDQFRDRRERPDPEQVLLERADKTLRHPVALGLPDEAGRAGHPQEGQLGLEVVTHVSAAVVVPDAQSVGDAPVEAAEALADTLAERLQRLEPAARLRGMQADALPGAVIDRD